MSTLTDVELHTTLGAIYKFPDVDEGELDRFVRDFRNSGQVTLSNVSGACLVLPARIVKTILIGGVERWTI